MAWSWCGVAASWAQEFMLESLNEADFGHSCHTYANGWRRAARAAGPGVSEFLFGNLDIDRHRSIC